LQLGFLADFFSRTVLVGFLTGVGCQVGIAVLGDMLGVRVSGHRTVQQLAELGAHLRQVHLPTLTVSAVLVGSILAGRRFLPSLPVPLLAVGVAIGASHALDFAGHGLALIGPIAGGMPSLTWPRVGWSETLALVPTTASCFLIIVAQSAATARARALSHHERLDVNADLLGLSAANLAAAVSGAFVVNGSPTQTAMAERAGARSQMAPLAAAGVVVLVLLFLTGPLHYLPRAVLAGIVFTIAIGLVDVKQLAGIRRESPGEFWLAVVTAATVALVGVQQGVLLATVLSLLHHVRHSYRPHTSVLAPDGSGHWQPIPATPGVQTEPGLIVYHFGADLFYANEARFADEVRGLVSQASGPVRWLVVDAAAITDIDYSAARTVRDLSDELTRQGVGLVFTRVNSYLRADMDRHGITEALGVSRVFASLHEALASVRGKAPLT
jgi:SulP family sulfate permease